MYYILYGLLYLISLLPMWILYGISDFFYCMVYYVFKYRREVVMSNLSLAFPEKTEKEKIIIAKKFYRNLIDTFIETLKILSSGVSFFRKRFTSDISELEAAYRSGKKAQLHLGHTFNWEWANYILSKTTLYKVLIVYMPLKGKFSDRLFKTIRQKGGATIIPATPPDAFRKALVDKRDFQTVLTLVADQNPGDKSKAYWIDFMGQPTPFVTGPEKGACMGKLPAFFAHITKRKRGYYHAVTPSITGNDETIYQTRGAITVKYVRMLEELIRQHPEMWLWSHKRWRHKWEPQYASQWIGDPALMPNAERMIPNA